MKIALLTPTFAFYSGIDRVVQLQAENLAKEGHNVTVYCFKSEIKPKGYKIRIIGMPKSNTLQRIYRLFMFINFPLIKKISKELKEFDKVISHFYPMNWFAWYAKNKFNIEYVYYDYGVATPDLFQNFAEKMYMRLFKRLNNFTIKNADHAISISKYLSKELEKETGLKSKVVYPPIDTKRFNLSAKGDQIRKKYNLGSNPVILFVGRISPHKGVDLLLESFTIAKKSISNLKLLIVGKETFDDYFNKLKNNAPDGVIFTGFVPDDKLPKYYASCNLYTTATLWEGYDLPITEAQACGKRSVAFDLCSHPEVLKIGTLVKPRDTVAFAKAIVKELKTIYH